MKDDWITPDRLTPITMDIPISLQSNSEYTSYLNGWNDGQRKLLKHLRKLAKQYSMPNTYSAGIPVDEIERMLRKIEA